MTALIDFVNIPVDQIVPYENNPRKIGADAIDAVAESLRRYGFQQPLVVDRNNVIVVGHTRFAAAQKLGLQEVPCVRADDLNEEQIREYRIIDNKSGEKSVWDFELLQHELSGLDTQQDVFALNFTPYELDTIFNVVSPDEVEKVERSEASDEVAMSKVVLEFDIQDQDEIERWLKQVLQNCPVEHRLK